MIYFLNCRENGSSEDTSNPGNNLYVTGLSTRVTEKELEAHFSQEGKVKLHPYHRVIYLILQCDLLSVTGL